MTISVSTTFGPYQSPDKIDAVDLKELLAGTSVISRDCCSTPAGSESELESGHDSSARGDGLGFLSCQALSAILSNGAVDNGAAVETFPRIKDEKEV